MAIWPSWLEGMCSGSDIFLINILVMVKLIHDTGQGSTYSSIQIFRQSVSRQYGRHCSVEQYGFSLHMLKQTCFYSSRNQILFGSAALYNTYIELALWSVLCIK